MEYLLCSISDQNNEGSSPRESCMKVITPRNPAARGAQLSLMFPFNINDFFVELQKRGVIVSLNIICNTIPHSEVHRKTRAEIFSNGIVGRDLGTKQKVTSQIRSHNTIVDEFGTSLPLNFGKANGDYNKSS